MRLAMELGRLMQVELAQEGLEALSWLWRWGGKCRFRSHRTRLELAMCIGDAKSTRKLVANYVGTVWHNLLLKSPLNLLTYPLSLESPS